MFLTLSLIIGFNYISSDNNIILKKKYKIDYNELWTNYEINDKILSYKGITYKLGKDTWPELLPDIEEEEPKVKKEEVVVEE